MAEPATTGDVISGSVVLIILSVLMFNSCSDDKPESVSEVPAKTNIQPTESDLVSVLKGSDDYSENAKAFIDAANTLIGDRRCKFEDFSEMGGWVKSTNYRDSPVYFTYCTGLKRRTKIHLDTSDGRIFYGTN